MNSARRKEIERLIEVADELMGCIEDVRSEEEEYLDNMPEGLKDGAKGDAAQEAIDSLSEASEAVQSAIDFLESAMQ